MLHGTRVSSYEAGDPEYSVRDGLQDWLSAAMATPFDLTGDEPCIQDGVDPEDWYDNFGTLLREDGARVPVTKSLGQKRAEAERLCHGCPSRTTCLTAALESQVQWGIWGGLIPADREAMKRNRGHLRLAAAR